MSSKQEKAADLLVFYMANAWKAAGLQWQGDNESETRAIVDLIVDAVSERDHSKAQRRRYVRADAGPYREHVLTTVPQPQGGVTVYEGTPSGVTGPVFDGPAWAGAKYVTDRDKDLTARGYVLIES